MKNYRTFFVISWRGLRGRDRAGDNKLIFLWGKWKTTRVSKRNWFNQKNGGRHKFTRGDYWLQFVLSFSQEEGQKKKRWDPSYSLGPLKIFSPPFWEGTLFRDSTFFSWTRLAVLLIESKFLPLFLDFFGAWYEALDESFAKRGGSIEEGL